MSQLPLVAIVGRPNVGKSSLFNRLVGGRRAIVDEEAGLTRDRLYGKVDWRGRDFNVVDTAGLDAQAAQLERRRDDAMRAELAENTQRGTMMAVEEADVIIFVVDVRAGLTAADEDVARTLRRSKIPVVLAANKSESPKDPGYLHEMYSLGFGEPLPVSALQGSNTGDLLDRVVELLPPAEDVEALDPGRVSVCILGRPNVGKSSLLNAILGRERSLVAALPGTTRDPVDTEVMVGEQPIILVDTAGIRRKGVTKGGIEHYTLLRAFRALERADVALMVIDAAEGIRAQDQHIAGYATEAGKGVALVVNKWDLLPAEDRDDAAWRTRISKDFQFIPGLPVVYASALSGRHVKDVLPMALQVAEARNRRISTGELNRTVREAVASFPPPLRKSRQLKVLYATQGRERTPTIIFFVNDPELAHFSYRRYLENRIREVHGFAGVPLRILFRSRDEDD
ncbi:MAG TPA: ribosome biogenesis GTPase Der [Candidatus Dormibacteraeota bacterium]|nr:ribosome biogenesis GTPase Der [Candidatus Dormibacteraeota bacterium]